MPLVPHQSDRWLMPVRPMAPVRPLNTTGQAGGKQQMQSKVLRSLSDSSRPWNKNRHRRTTCQEGKPLTKPNKSTPDEPRTRQLENRTTPHEHSSSPRQIPQGASTSQTGHAWAARDEQHPRVNSPKTNSRSPKSLHGFVQDFGDSRNTSWALHSQDLIHQNLLNQKESRKSHQECL
jgi:hypothetical protein